ncbi:MAG TPA: M90 family metallopeptidase [Gemmata sp.]|jgi:hypothetical protein|nr:M90 family metallopeptidase [Gemmata sp.]
MLFSWLDRRRREHILAAPFRADWLDYLQKNVALYSFLSATDQAKLRDDLRIFISEKSWEGCGGLTMTDEIKVTIAAQACLLLLGVEHEYFDHVQTILVYPSAYRAPDGEVGPDGVVHEGIGRLGEAWPGGPVILGWDAVLEGGRNPEKGNNVVLHEFAHQLDFLDGLADGTPPLRSAEEYRRWHAVMTAEYDRLCKASDQGKATVLDQYGATNPAEFFAVATECFFEKPLQLQHSHPQMYDVLRDYYFQNPVTWFMSTGTETSPHRHRRPYRGNRSRKNPATVRDPAFKTKQPGWVRFWMLGTYWSRDVAVERLRYMLYMLVASLVFGGLTLAGMSRRLSGAVIGFVLAGILGFSAAWLWLAVKWVDRHGWKKPHP